MHNGREQKKRRQNGRERKETKKVIYKEMKQKQNNLPKVM